MDETQIIYAEWTKGATKKYLLYDSILIKSKYRQIWSLVKDIRSWLLMAVERFCILIWVMVTRVHTIAKTYQIEYFGFMDLVVL